MTKARDLANGGFGLVLMNTTSFTSSTGVNIDSVFNSNYENYKIIVRATHSSGDLKMQGRVAGSTIAANYGVQRFYADNTTVAAVRTSGASDWFIGEGVALKSQIIIDLGGPNVAEKTTGVGFDSRGLNTLHGISFLHDALDQFDGIRVYPTSGTMTGTVSVYGYHN
jgi:hypothetical protein